MRSLPAGDDVRAQGALAAALDHGARRLEQHGEISGEQFRPCPAQPEQPVALSLDLLAVVEHVGHIAGRTGELRGQP